jgi:hypothetical protein
MGEPTFQGCTWNALPMYDLVSQRLGGVWEEAVTLVTCVEDENDRSPEGHLGPPRTVLW